MIATHRRPGFTLVEICVVLALTGVLAASAWPPMKAQLQRSQRADAVAALTRLQLAQESHRAHHGLYASQLVALAGASASRSREGLYAIELAADGPDGYRASATARAGTLVADDSACAVMSVRVHEGQAEIAPSARCWNR
jgi:type IV pilus assembly protein PilE